VKKGENTMENRSKKEITPDIRLTAVCGLFCPSCTLYIGTHEDPNRLEWLAERFGCPVEDLECHGCRSEKRALYCKTRCTFGTCAGEKGVDFCGECPEYPCEALKVFQAEMPHRIELWNSHQRIQEVGYETWFRQMIKHYACPECQTINSAYDIACRQCGTTPSCAYVQLHKDTIEEYLKKAEG
jgi:hypothetical protein